MGSVARRLGVARRAEGGPILSEAHGLCARLTPGGVPGLRTALPRQGGPAGPVFLETASWSLQAAEHEDTATLAPPGHSSAPGLGCQACAPSWLHLVSPGMGTVLEPTGGWRDRAGTGLEAEDSEVWTVDRRGD